MTLFPYTTLFRSYKMELFWLSNAMATEIIKETWSEVSATHQQQGVHRFRKYCEMVHQRLRNWHCSNFDEMDQQLLFCKKTLLFFDQIEERRSLQGYERRFRIMVRERAYNLACIIESRWKHRSHCKWLKVGDKNTRYFHALASAKQRRNRVSFITYQGHTITEENCIRESFRSQMESLLGTTNSVLHFTPQSLYPENPDLSTLQEPFTLLEIEEAVKQLAKNKSSGPDGIPNEFLQLHWITVKDEVCDMIQQFYAHNLDLSGINQANIIMIAKKDNATQIGDYRPISVMNAIPKLISKLLANRLRGLLPELISSNQPAFVHGRQITENFNSTREILHHISNSGRPACFIKLDFAKAFDSVNWSYLRCVLEARGFPLRWIKWIEILLSTASSRIVMNGGESEFFFHKKGLRQGDPLSPMLFDIVVDVLSRMMDVLNATVQSQLSRKLKKAVIIHQYADDTVFIANAEPNTIISLKILFLLFTKVSGLSINFDKSTWIPVNIATVHLQAISAVLGCPRSDFPIIYLGLPLTLKRPHKELFLPLIEKIESKLDGWKGKLISRGGRLQLMNSVLSSIPIYFMSSFLLPIWVINRIDKIRRDFLWGKTDKRKGISLINWEVVCLPKELGGLGAANLVIRNKALLLRWWWRVYKTTECLWAQTVSQLYNLTTSAQSHQIWKREGSFFWSQLQKIRPLFDMSVRWSIGNGELISYWFDSWTYPTMAAQIRPNSSNRKMSLQVAIERGICQVNVVLGQAVDRIQWLWTNDNEYTANSYYKTVVAAGKTKWDFRFIWQLKIPPTVRVFAYLLLQNRLLTHEVMMHRGLQCEMQCEVCQECPYETAMHLFFQCRQARRVWSAMHTALRFNIRAAGNSVQVVTYNSLKLCRRFISRQHWGSLFFAVCWFIWRSRNRRIFDGTETDPQWIAHHSIKEAKLWRKFC